jgi:hypothetical protein
MKKSVFILLLLGCFLAAPAQYIPRVNKATLALMREQQKLSRDVYDSLHQVWDVRIFEEIGGAEENHMEAVKTLLDQFVVEDPVATTGDAPGRFVHPPLQRLYDSLLLSGAASLEGAYRAGAYMEEMDIVDLHRAVQATASEDLKAVYKYIMVAAERHLLTFTRQLKKMGVIYEPALMAKREYDRIIGASGGGTE